MLLGYLWRGNWGAQKTGLDKSKQVHKDQWFNDHCIPLFCHPPNFPDLSSIRPIWQELKNIKGWHAISKTLLQALFIYDQWFIQLSKLSCIIRFWEEDQAQRNPGLEKHWEKLHKNLHKICNYDLGGTYAFSKVIICHHPHSSTSVEELKAAVHAA